MAGSPKYEGILVEDRAIGSDQDQKYVMIVQPDGLTKYQRVELGPIVDGLRVVRSGLKGNETVIVEGIGKVRPNLKVNAKQTDMNKANVRIQRGSYCSRADRVAIHWPGVASQR
jgi:multidrug efflux pump subunit AcrA (membrane-fusion protein)